MRNYPRLDIYRFGEHLLASGDLDPIYCALHSLLHLQPAWDRAQVERWLVAYWCLYHAGAASFLSESEGETFWNGLLEAAANDAPAPTGGRWPRGHERRHWRGQQAIAAQKALVARYERPEHMVDFIATGPLDFASVSSRAQQHRSFGPWISFKIGDMLERVLHVPVLFDEAHVFMFDDPTKAAIQLWRVKQGLDREANVHPKDKVAQGKIIHGVVEHLTEHFADFSPPPRGGRDIGLQEVETILCKWKSHMNGHYPLNNDIREIRAGLAEWAPRSIAARQFLDRMPEEG